MSRSLSDLVGAMADLVVAQAASARAADEGPQPQLEPLTYPGVDTLRSMSFRTRSGLQSVSSR